VLQTLSWWSANWEAYAWATGWTAIITIAASLGALIWGSTLLLFWLGLGRWGRYGVDAYVQVLRNIPVLLPIYLIYFGFPLIGLVWPAAICGGVALVMQNGAYVSEIFRGSYKAIDRVQFDAAKSLGLSSFDIFRKVTLPQVMTYSIPPLGNQAVLLMKDTSLLSAITVVEITMLSKMVTERSGAAYTPFIFAAILYLFLATAIGRVFRVAEWSVRWR
jgi:polar amino acid transport system permease protein